MRLPPYGPATLCAYALNRPRTRGVDALLGCREFTSGYGTPFGAVDPPLASAVGAHMRGWIIDPDHFHNGLGCPGHTCWLTDYVAAVVDGGVHDPGTSATTTLPATLTRPDVNAAFPEFTDTRNVGFDLDTALTSGQHEICVVALDGSRSAVPIGLGNDRPLGCVHLIKP